MTTKRINTRRLTSFFMLFGFTIMALTGLVLYVVPVGRNASWIDWSLIGLAKADWEHIHLLSSFLFITAGIFHISFNWKPIVHNFKSKISESIKSRRELIIAALVTVFVLISGLYALPPLSYLLDLNETIQDSWIAQEEYKPPFGRAERFSLNEFAQKEQFDLPRAVDKLQAYGITLADTSETLKDLARNNNTTPMELYIIIKYSETPPVPTEP